MKLLGYIADDIYNFLLGIILNIRLWYNETFLFRFENPYSDMVCTNWKTRLLFYLFPFVCSYFAIVFISNHFNVEIALLALAFVPIYFFFDIIRAGFARSIWWIRNDKYLSSISKESNSDNDNDNNNNQENHLGYYDRF